MLQAEAELTWLISSLASSVAIASSSGLRLAFNPPTDPGPLPGPSPSVVWFKPYLGKSATVGEHTNIGLVMHSNAHCTGFVTNLKPCYLPVDSVRVVLSLQALQIQRKVENVVVSRATAWSRGAWSHGA